MVKWFEEKGFDFATAGSRLIFVHKTSIRGSSCLKIGKAAVFRIIADPCPGTDKWKSLEA